MTEQRYTYATVGVNEKRDEPVVVTGKENATFEVGSEEFERTAILKLPERMTSSEFNQWKSEAGVDLIDIYFHCLHQTPRHPEPAEEAAEPEDGQQPLVTDGGSEPDFEEVFLGQEQLLEPTAAFLNECNKAGCNPFDVLVAYLREETGEFKRVHEEFDAAYDRLDSRAAEESKRITPDGDIIMTDGGSSMPKLSLATLKELREVDGKIAEWLSEHTGEEFDSFSGIYPSEHSRPEANNDIELGDGFSVKEAEYVELLGMLEQSRMAAANEPTVLGVRNRLLMQFILANPEEYARVKAEESERQREAQEEARKRFNEAKGRERMNRRMADLGTDGVDIPIGEDEESND